MNLWYRNPNLPQLRPQEQELLELTRKEIEEEIKATSKKGVFSGSASSSSNTPFPDAAQVQREVSEEAQDLVAVARTYFGGKTAETAVYRETSSDEQARCDG